MGSVFELLVMQRWELGAERWLNLNEGIGISL